MFALGLPGFCTYLYLVRVLQSMQRTKVAFYLYLVENALNIVLAVALVHPLGVRGLALSLSIAYTVAAVLALAVFRQWFGRLAERETWAPLWRVVVATVPMGVVVLVVSNLSGSTSVAGLLARVVGAVVAGGLTFGAVVVWLGRRHDAAAAGRRRRAPARARSAPSANPAGAPAAAPDGPSGLLGAGPPVADSLHARRPHRDRQCLRPDRPARQGAQRHRGAADHPLRRRGARGPAPAEPGRVLGALPRQGRPARDRRPLPRRLPGRLPAGGRRGRRRRAVPDHLLQGVGHLRLGRRRRPTPSSRVPVTRRRHLLAHHGPGPAGHRGGRGGRRRRRPRRAGRRHRGPHRPHPHLRRAGRPRAPPAGRAHRRAPAPCSVPCSTSSR